MKSGTQLAPAQNEPRTALVELFPSVKMANVSAVVRKTAGLLVFLAASSGLGAWEKRDVLDAIHQVENPRDTLRMGRRGELGPFQFRPTVWSKYTEKPFTLATDLAEAQAVAEAHYDWITRGLVRNGFEVTPYHIGLVWNAGLHATVNNRASDQSKQYAQRVANLVEYADSTKNSPVVEAEKPAPSS